MTGKEEMIVSTFKQIVPQLTELQKERLIGFGEGLEYAVKTNAGQKETETSKAS